jgi:hypothetical protein
MGGSPEPVEATPTRPIGSRLAWASERAIVALKPGNAGGAKGPYFGCVSEEEKEEVIDDKSATPRKIRELQKRLYEKAKQVSHQSALREPVAKSVGKPDAGNRHVRFDERGRETTGCQ